MNLYVFDKNIEMKGLLENYSSLIWRRKYNECGAFEIHCAVSKENLELLKIENIVWKNDDVEAGYIMYKNIVLNENGEEILIVKGLFLTGYLKRRIIWNTTNLKTTSELAIRQIVNENAIDPLDVDRKMMLFELSSAKGYTQNTDLQTSYKNLFDEVKSIANASELGIRTILDLDNKKIVFDIYEGIDRTFGNLLNAPAIFSREYENVLSQDYSESDSDYKNVALVAGEGEGVDRIKVTVGEETGINRAEMFVDAREIAMEEMTITDYQNKLIEKGNINLSVQQKTQSFDSKININSNLNYKTDFDLGDIVTYASKSWGVMADVRIVEVEEVYEESGKQINVTFGKSMLTFMEKIKGVI